jgi:hypothetical protein
VGGSFPGAADAGTRECEELLARSFPAADEETFDPVLPFAAMMLELAAASSATVRSAASALSFLVIVHSFVW